MCVCVAGVLMIYVQALNYTRRGELADIAVVDGGPCK